MTIQMNKVYLTLTKNEKSYGYVKSDKLIKTFDYGYKFDGAEIVYLDGTRTDLSGHNRGQFHMHNSIQGRIDGFTDAFSKLTSDCISIFVEDNVIYIEELNQNNNVSSQGLEASAEEVRKLLGIE